MLSVAMDTAKLFFAGRLFKDNKLVVKQLLMGAGVGAVAIVVAGHFLPVWLAAVIGGGISGALQPVLFKDLKYA